MYKHWKMGLVSLVLCTAATAHAALTSQGLINIEAVKPTGINGYVGGGVAFIPGGTDSIAENTLVINWAVTDTVDSSKLNQVFQRITIPVGGGTPNVLATATIRWDMLFDGTNQYGKASGGDLLFDAANKKLVYAGTGTYATRFINFNLFSGNTAITGVGYSAANADNTQNFGRVLTQTPDGKYMGFYTFGTKVRKVTISPQSMNGGALTKTDDIVVPAAPGWYPNADGYPGTAYGNNCEGAFLYGDSYLLLRSFKNTATTKQEAHLYQVGSAFDTAAITAYADLGDVQQMANLGSDSRGAWGLGADPNSGTAFVRYGYINQAGTNGRIQIVTGLPSVPEPATLVLLVGSLAVTALRRRTGF